jgi:hypothetical protein
MIRVTYHDRLQAAPVVTFHALHFKDGEPVPVPDDWSGLETARTHPHFSVDNGHVEKPKSPPPEPINKPVDKIAENIPIGQARARGREAHTSGHDRAAPAHFSAAQRKAWLEGFDRARRKART